MTLHVMYDGKKTWLIEMENGYTKRHRISKQVADLLVKNGMASEG